MKKLILLAGLYCLQPALHAAPLSTSSKTNIAPTSASERAKAHFRENYMDVPNAAWYNTPDNSIYCTFQLGTTVERVFYDQQGYWQFTLISYPPTRLKEQLKRIGIPSILMAITFPISTKSGPTTMNRFI